MTEGNVVEMTYILFAIAIVLFIAAIMYGWRVYERSEPPWGERYDPIEPPPPTFAIIPDADWLALGDPALERQRNAARELPREAGRMGHWWN